MASYMDQITLSSSLMSFNAAGKIYSVNLFWQSRNGYFYDTTESLLARTSQHDIQLFISHGSALWRHLNQEETKFLLTSV